MQAALEEARACARWERRAVDATVAQVQKEATTVGDRQSELKKVRAAYAGPHRQKPRVI